MNVIRILAQYEKNSAMKVHRKESQPHFFGFCLIFRFFGLTVYEIDL